MAHIFACRVDNGAQAVTGRLTREVAALRMDTERAWAAEKAGRKEVASRVVYLALRGSSGEA